MFPELWDILISYFEKLIECKKIYTVGKQSVLAFPFADDTSLTIQE